MHVMEGECDKSSEMVAESAPDLISAEDMKLTKEDLLASKQDPEAAVAGVTEEAARSTEQQQDTDKTEVESTTGCLTVPVVNGDVKDEKNDSNESVVKVTCVENGKDEERTKPVVSDEKEENAPCAKEIVKEVLQEVKEGGSGGCSEEEDRNSVTSSQSRKRAVLAEVEVEGEGSSSESDAGGGKRARLEGDDGEDERERLVREYVEECSESVEDMSRAADKLQREIGALGELLRAKELEWNSILRLRKLKEEMLERLLRRRRLSAVLLARDDCQPDNKITQSGKPSPVNSHSMPNSHHPPHSNAITTNGGLMMVPIVSSSPGPGSHMPPFNRGPRMPEPPPHGRNFRMQRPILPKPPLIDQNSVVGEGRSRHPEHVPRRGRRQRPPDGPQPPQPPVVSSTRISGSPALMSMANMALGSGSHVRENPAGPSFIGGEGSRPSSADSSRSGAGHGPHLDMLPAPGLSFKDALVQFAKMSQPPKPPPPPPPYPEVTLHPVPNPHSPPPPPTHTSLLHGILTKNPPSNHPPPPTNPHRATTFSPTLARLLTAPERNAGPGHAPGTPGHFRPPISAASAGSRATINEIISSSKKNRNEITITPVSGSNKTKDDVVLLADDDEENDGDRLVIDESRDNGTNSELPDNVPECQGCHQRSAQFVCAGCGNQWYCSRECQVTAWEDHSEMCSG